MQSKNITADKPKTYTLINAKNTFLITLVVMVLTILGVYFWGLGQHHTFFKNSLISTTILSVSFFLFITIGLYRGVKLKDNLGAITDKIKLRKLDGLPDLGTGSDFDGDNEGCLGIILGIILWIIAAITLAIILWVFGNILEIGILAFAGMLYWISFRALRLVFRHSNRCKSNLWGSIRIGLFYNFLYNFLILVFRDLENKFIF